MFRRGGIVPAEEEGLQDPQTAACLPKKDDCHEHVIHDGIHKFPQCILRIPVTPIWSQSVPYRDE